MLVRKSLSINHLRSAPAAGRRAKCLPSNELRLVTCETLRRIVFEFVLARNLAEVVKTLQSFRERAGGGLNLANCAVVFEGEGEQLFHCLFEFEFTFDTSEMPCPLAV